MASGTTFRRKEKISDLPPATECMTEGKLCSATIHKLAQSGKAKDPARVVFEHRAESEVCLWKIY